MRKLFLHSAAKPVVFALCLLPLAWLVYAAAANQLGANPAEALIRATGDWTLRALCLVLAVTPLRVLTATPQLARFRRMLGLFVFFYGLLHLLCYAWFDMGFDLADTLQDIIKRPFIWLGFSAFVILLALAATQTDRYSPSDRAMTLASALPILREVAPGLPPDMRQKALDAIERALQKPGSDGHIDREARARLEAALRHADCTASCKVLGQRAPTAP